MRTLEQIDDFIRIKAADGTVPGNIAGSLGLPVGFVFGRMDALGIERDEYDNSPKYRVHPKWDAEPDVQRFWIWERQRDGARDTLRGQL